MALEWLDEIEARVSAATPWTEQGAELTDRLRRDDIPRLCRAVRELVDALQTAIELADAPDGATHMDWWQKRRQAAADALERWRRGGD